MTSSILRSPPSPIRRNWHGLRTAMQLIGLLIISFATSVLAAAPPVVPIAPIASGSSGSETRFDDVVVRAEQTGGGTVTHGYSEFRFTVSNRGTRQRTVEIAAPASRFDFAAGSLSRISRTVVLAPGTSATLSLLQPALMVSGHGAEVIIDGTKQTDEIVFAPTYASGPALSILGSRAVSDSELRTTLELHLRPEELAIQTAATETNEWSRNWLSYSTYDAIVMTSREHDRAEADVRQAIDRFTRTGGVLVILGAIPAADCAGRMSLPESLSFCPRGFGLRVTTSAAFADWGTDDVKALVDEIRRTQEPLKAWGGPIHPTRGPEFAVVENLSVPLRGLFIAMILFAITAGPVNIAVLAKMNRRIWIIWTLPAIALVTSALVIVFATFSEGWVRAARTEAITWIDADTREATTIGWTGYYATVAPGDGLRFDSQTELHPFGGSRNNILTLDWTSGQHLASGWLSSRVTSTFRIRKSEPRRERLTFRRDENGLSVSNGLGADVTEIWVADERGTVWTAKNVDAGGTKSLERSATGAVGGNELRALYANDWVQAGERLLLAPGTYLEAGRWAAVLDGSPFVEDAMSGIRTRKARTIVMSDLRIGETE